MDSPYWTVDDAIIFKPEFDSSLDDYTSIISNYRILIFSNYSDPHQALKNNNIYDDEEDMCVGSSFNQPLIKFFGNKNFYEAPENNPNPNTDYFPGRPLGNSLLDLTNLHELSLGEYFNQPLNNSLTNLVNLRKLTFGNSFNQPLNDSLSKLVNLENLTFEYYFNQPLNDSLSNLHNLQELTFGNCFNQPLNDSLLNLINLQILTFDSTFNKPLNDSLSKLVDLRELTFGICFNQPLNNSLSNLTNLKKLTFDDKFNQPLDNTLSNLHNLRELTLGDRFKQPINIPNWITKLTLDCNSQSIIEYLPSSIVELKLGPEFNLELDNLPNTIKKIKIQNPFYNKKLNNLPSGIETLKISYNCKKLIVKKYKNLNITYF